MNRSISVSTRLAALATATAGLVVPLTLSPAQAANADVVISELMYQASSELDSDEFLEITNTGAEPVDISGWCFGGITFCFPAATTIGAGQALVVSPDAARTQSVYGAASAGTYTGSLKNSGETISLKDAANATVDSVSYLDVAPWPVLPDGLGPSLELIDASADNSLPRNWAAATNTPGHSARAANSVAGALGPDLTAVTGPTTRPAANTPITISATVNGAADTVTLFYRVGFAAEQSLPMTGDNGTYTAQIPGVSAGALVRYRVAAQGGGGTTSLPRTDDSMPYQGVVAAHGVTSQIPIFEWFMDPADYAAVTARPTAQIRRRAILAYDGVVWDNIMASIKGQSTQTSPKPSWKLEFPHNHDFTMPGLIEPVDEFALQADWSDRARGKAYLSWEVARLAKLANMQMFPIRVQRNGAFQGLYKFQEQFDGTWRDREGRGDDEVYKASSGAFVTSRALFENRFEKKEGDPLDYRNLEELLDAVIPEGQNARDFLRANADIPELINYAVFVSVVRHVDSSQKNFYLARESRSQRWEMFPWDQDLTWGGVCCGVTSTFVTPAEPGDQTNVLLRVLLSEPQWREMYFRRLRTVVDQVYPAGTLEGWYDAKFSPAAADSNLDFATWPYSRTYTYNGSRTSLFNQLAARRAIFANDVRVPAAQGAAPTVVISEIAASPAAGATAQFVELANPSTSTAVDISGWQLSGAVSATLQQGLVIPPASSISIVANDPAFRSAYSSQILVGDRFTGTLASTGTITLSRLDASVADSVAFGGDGWPVPAAGETLELSDLNADNGDPVAWGLSARPGGSPSAANGAADTATAPGAPQPRPSVPGDTQVIVNWRAPFRDGGAAITAYVVQARNSGGQAVGSPVQVAGSARTATVTGLPNNQALTFAIQAINRVGTGATGTTSAVTPAAGLTAPGSPIIATATTGASGGLNTVVARWNSPSTTGGSPITGYRAYAMRMSSASASAYVVETLVSPIVTASKRSFEFEAEEGYWRFEVVAVNAVGTSARSARSNAIQPQ
ncbi:MAG: lamin tail domain-containing protein [Nocardioides sp.]